jgi:hypothetical protein
MPYFRDAIADVDTCLSALALRAVRAWLSRAYNGPFSRPVVVCLEVLCAARSVSILTPRPSRSGQC